MEGAEWSIAMVVKGRRSAVVVLVSFMSRRLVVRRLVATFLSRGIFSPTGKLRQGRVTVVLNSCHDTTLEDSNLHGNSRLTNSRIQFT